MLRRYFIEAYMDTSTKMISVTSYVGTLFRLSLNTSLISHMLL